ncbi:569_t:CDS:2 [Paraglomus occultum]|uniref:569_t:CDS:1 n=1 Tax=Paraglomus occultum TaxID=144539 RepID=A0A9N8WKH1_9GLOM|nr:569_t:CDS:2 [Paraglomus occultum]
MSQNSHQREKTKFSLKSNRGWKARTDPNKFDPTGRSHSMIVNPQNGRKRNNDAAYGKEQHPLPMVEPVAEYAHTTMMNIGMGRHYFAQMTTEQLRIYSIFFEIVLLNYKPT